MPVNIVRANWWKRLWAANPYVVDGIIATVLIITSLGSLLFVSQRFDRPGGPADALAVVLILVGIGSLTFRRRWPLAVLAIAAACSYAYFARDYTNTNLDTAVAIAAWTVATRVPERWILAACAALPTIPLALLVDGRDIGEGISAMFFVGIVSVVGYNVQLRREKRSQEARVEVLEADTAVADERLRIARELHDVVAHAMSVVAVQAGVAAHVIDTQPDEAKRMLENVRVTSHDALDEMRRLRGAGRRSHHRRPERHPGGRRPHRVSHRPGSPHERAQARW